MFFIYIHMFDLDLDITELENFPGGFGSGLVPMRVKILIRICISTLWVRNAAYEQCCGDETICFGSDLSLVGTCLHSFSIKM